MVRLAAALVITFAGAAAADAPARVVSVNLCTDQLAMLIAAPGQLQSVSWLAADPSVSLMPDQARATGLTTDTIRTRVFIRRDRRIVIPGLVPGIHHLKGFRSGSNIAVMGGRDKPGHDG